MRTDEGPMITETDKASHAARRTLGTIVLGGSARMVAPFDAVSLSKTSPGRVPPAAHRLYRRKD